MPAFPFPRRAAALLALSCAAPALAAPFAYVPNSGSNDVTVIDLATNTVAATVAVGAKPYGVGITKNYRYVYVANFDGNSVSVIDATTNAVATTIAGVCTNPAFAEPSPNGTEMWISCFNQAKVAIIDIATNTVVGQVAGQSRPLGIAFNADGSRAYVVSNTGSTMRIIDTATRTQLTSVSIGTNSTDVQLNPAGTEAWVVANGNAQVRGIRLSNNQWESGINTGTGPVALTFLPSGTRVYVSNISLGTVTVGTVSNGATSTITVGNGPSGVDRNADGSRVYVANESGNRVSVIDTATNTVIANIPVGTTPKAYGRFVAKGAPASAAPDAPGDVVATAGLGQASVAFAPPANDGGSPVIDYTATCGAQSATGTASPIVVANLAPGVPVTCTVAARTLVGTGAASAPSNAVVPYARAPDAPTGVVVSGGDFELSVAFAAPFDGLSPITQYAATCTSPASATVWQATGTASPVVVAGTPNGQAYACHVVATNAIGDGPPSADAGGATPDVVPARPVLLAATRGNGSIAVAFEAGDAPHGHSPITRWTATCGPQSAWVVGTDDQITVAGLPNGVPQTCTVVATNGAGDSLPSAPSLPVTPATRPGAPAVTAVTRGNASATVAYAAPASDGGEAILDYEASCGSATGGPTLANPIVVAGLANGTAVTCAVRARNALGHGSWSAESAPVTPATLPDAPANVVATRGNGQVSLAFDAPGDGGLPISGYTATCGSRIATGAAPPLVVTGLANGTGVTCTVFATNELGDGPASAPSNAATPATVPGAPSVTSVTRGNGRVTVGYAVPASDGGDPIIGHIINCGDVTVFGGNNPLPVAGLPNGVPVTCRVRAKNGVGDGDWSDWSAPVTPATVPDAPTDVVATRGDGQASVAFAAPPSDGGAGISGYVATCGAQGANGAAPPIVVGNLANGVAVTCTVYAVNDVGAGPASGVSASVVPAFVADLAVTIDNGTRFIAGGGQTQYLVDVTNAGARGVTGVRVRDAFAAPLANVTWICSGENGSTCPPGGSGDIDATVDLAPNARVSFLVTATVVALPETPAANTVTITAPASVDDPASANDSATDGPDAVGLFADGFQ